jgi:hypothetical protein
MSDVLIELDNRRRATVRLGRHSRYLAHEEPDGTLILKPAVVLTEAELALRSNPALVQRIEDAIARPETMVRRGRPKRKA